MMRLSMKQFAKPFARRSESGQTIVIMALGFIALLAFVGIVTDVSLMFLNFNTLTRAVDSASVAAAGQVRRMVPSDAELWDACGTLAPPPGAECVLDANAEAFARSFANVGVAARQFLEFYGVNPKAVLVDMCSTVSIYNEDTDQLEPAAEGMEDDFNQLCGDDNNQRKLIRVTAQSSSPTVFLRLVGWPDIVLEASAISETAVLDVVLIMDVSESMLNETTYRTWAEEGYNNIYLPPRVTDENGEEIANDFGGYVAGWASDNAFYRMSQNGQELVNQRMERENNPADGLYDPNGPYRIYELGFPDPVNYTGPARPSVRAACQVRYYPYSVAVPVPTDLRSLYSRAGMPYVTSTGNWLGFMPTFDYYDCCNDPDGNGTFEDLLCQPFRQARDATEGFLQRIDFLRGDRVAFVTFDREAFLVNIEDENGEITHMIESEGYAVETLRRYIGVRAEPSYYLPSETTVDGETVRYVPWQLGLDGSPARSQRLSPDHDYPVRGNCPFQDATLGFPLDAGSDPWGPYRDIFPLNPQNAPNRLEPIMYPRGALWDTLRVTSQSAPQRFNANYSYDLWASCSGTNIGAGLREGSNALLHPRTTRTDGAVWVMVLLSDGAAAGSDPVFDGGVGTAPTDLAYPYTTRQPVQYGGLGLCPPGTTGGTVGTTQSELVDLRDAKDILGGNPTFPFCSDESPESRHFCFDPLVRNGAGEQTFVDLANSRFPECRTFYDVDDYARDWADWIGLAEPPGLADMGSAAEQRNAAQLPTIFSIGFGLNFEHGTTQCKAGNIRENAADPKQNDLEDCLGEELLRYIADVGDNFQIDTDYQQDWLDDRQQNRSLAINEWGDRGPCEEQNIDPTDSSIDFVQPLPAGQSCGNYYNAASGLELERVFDDIASRMFTRLTQ